MASDREPPFSDPESLVRELVGDYLEVKTKEAHRRVRSLADSVLARWRNWLAVRSVVDLKEIGIDVM